MKTYFLILFFSISLYNFAQDSILIENVWWLEDLIINSESNIPPSNEEVQPTYIDFYEHKFDSPFCSFVGADIMFDDVDTKFTILGAKAILLMICDQEPNLIFETLYFNFFNNNDDFNYSIVTNNDNNSSTLTLTSSNGDSAIYTSAILSIKNNLKSTFSIFYNTSKNSIDINSKNFSDNYLITLFDIHGKLLFELNEYISGEKSINIQNLPDGFYIIHIKNETGEVFSKKIVKY